MIQIRVTIPDRLMKKIEQSDLEESEIITQALDKYFNGVSTIEISHWQTYMENKITDLQQQLDAHRNGGGSHDTVLDSGVTRRGNGTDDPLDISSSKDLRVTPLTTPVPKTPIVSSLDDFDIPL